MTSEHRRALLALALLVPISTGSAESPQAFSETGHASVSTDAVPSETEAPADRRQADWRACEAIAGLDLLKAAECMATFLSNATADSDSARARLETVLGSVAVDLQDHLRAAVDPVASADLRFIAEDVAKIQDLARRSKVPAPKMEWAAICDPLLRQIRTAVKRQNLDDASTWLTSLRSLATSLRSAKLRDAAERLEGELTAATKMTQAAMLRPASEENMPDYWAERLLEPTLSYVLNVAGGMEATQNPYLPTLLVEDRMRMAHDAGRALCADADFARRELGAGYGTAIDLLGRRLSTLFADRPWHKSFDPTLAALRRKKAGSCPFAPRKPASASSKR